MLPPTKRPPTHPGEMLLEEFVRPTGLNGRLAWDLRHALPAPEAADIRKIRPVKKTEATSACIVPRPMNGQVHG